MKNKSFTLIEILVAVMVFTITVTLVFSTFYLTSSYRAKTMAINQVTQEANYIMEEIVRDIRKQKPDAIIGPTNTSFPESALTYEVRNGGLRECYQWYLEDNKVKRKKQTQLGGSACGDSGYQNDVILSRYNNVKVTSLGFQKEASSFAYTITLTVEANQASTKEPEKSITTLRTSITPRGY